MADIRRYYKCGCAPNNEQFCPIGDFLIWTGRDAMNELSIVDHMSEFEQIHCGNLDAFSAYLMNHHVKRQEEDGDFEDVDFDAPEMQPPDDYDETFLGR